MLKSSMVATLGTSPLVVTELLQYLISVGEKITDITIIYTSEHEVQACFKLVECAVVDRYPNIRVHGKMIDQPDIMGTQDAYDFLKFAAEVLREEVVNHGVQRIHLNLAGGRKGMTIALAILAQFFPVSGAYLVVARDVKAYNIELEKIRYNINEISKSADPLEYYRSNRELFEPVMYPSKRDYGVIELPIIPYPLKTLRDLLRLKRGECRLSRAFLERLKDAGLVTITRKNIYPSETFLKIMDILEDVI